jgi:predicted ATPase/class 3 adenylate cyclase/DNA-binding CsgD family transcriptional regulator
MPDHDPGADIRHLDDVLTLRHLHPVAMSETAGRGGKGFDALDWGQTLGGEDGFVLPVGTVTLLLGDVEGSTRQWEEHGPDMPARIATLDEMLDAAISAHQGVRPVEQGEGDSFVVAFSRASDALGCALELQRRLAAGPLDVRLGLHTGEVQLRGVGNYVGAFINRAARLRDVGHGGQVLVSRVTADLVGEHLPDDAGLLDLGSHRLRDLNRPEQVFQLVHPDLRQEFPPLRSLDSMPHNLPVQLTTFVGRTAERAALGKLIAEQRLVTLTGSGGCGKTRLALELAADALDTHPDGVWFCDLSALADADGVAQALAVVLGLRERSQGWEQVVATHLRESRTLVVLDNCEHVVAGCAALADALLRHCEGLTILATSREPLGVDGEISSRVPSLAAPDRREPTPIDAVSAFDAVRLFIDRARQARPNFAVTTENAAAVAEICARLDGIPLAIELAAARVRVLGVEQIAAGLSDRFRLLGGGARTAMPRQQTLLASVAWSHDLLGEPERAVLRRLAVFSGTFSLDAAEAVASDGAIGTHQVLEVLSQLVDRSLVQAEDAGGPVRYRLLETMRQYAGDRLVDAGEAIPTRDRHLAFYETWVVGTTERSTPSTQDADLAAIDAETDNIREALAWAVDSPENAERGLRIVGALWQHWILRGHFSEGQRWAESMLAAAPDAEPGPRAETMLTLAWMADLKQDFLTAITMAQEAAALARSAENNGLLARALEKIGYPLAMFDLDQGLAMLEESINLARAVGDRRTAGASLFFQGFQEVMHGRLEDGLRHFEESIAERELPDHSLEARQAHCGMALGAAAQGRFAVALDWLDDALGAFERINDPYWTLIAVTYRTFVCTQMGDTEGARAALDHAISAAETVDSQITVLVNAQTPAVLLGERRYSEVIPAVEAALPQVVTWGPRLGTAFRALLEALVVMTRVAEGDVAGGVALVDSMIGAARQADSVTYTAPVFTAAATARLAAGDDTAAEQLAHEALTACADTGALGYMPALLDVLGAVALEQASTAESARLLAAGAAARHAMGSWPASLGIDPELVTVRLREQMDDEGFEKAWAEGAALSLDDAVAYARRGRGERKRPPSGWASITPMEQQVIDLAATGMSNPEIAERLFISRRTVTSHLTHVFAKLGLKTRAELTAEALRRRH